MNSISKTCCLMLACLLLCASASRAGGESARQIIKTTTSVELLRIDKLLDGGSWRYEFAANGNHGIRIIPRHGFMGGGFEVLVTVDASFKHGERFSTDATISLTPEDEVTKVLFTLLDQYSHHLKEGDVRKERVLYLIGELNGKVAQGGRKPLEKGGWEIYAK